MHAPAHALTVHSLQEDLQLRCVVVQRHLLPLLPTVTRPSCRRRRAPRRGRPAAARLPHLRAGAREHGAEEPRGGGEHQPVRRQLGALRGDERDVTELRAPPHRAERRGGGVGGLRISAGSAVVVRGAYELEVELRVGGIGGLLPLRHWRQGRRSRRECPSRCSFGCRYAVRLWWWGGCLIRVCHRGLRGGDTVSDRSTSVPTFGPFEFLYGIEVVDCIENGTINHVCHTTKRDTFKFNQQAATPTHWHPHTGTWHFTASRLATLLWVSSTVHGRGVAYCADGGRRPAAGSSCSGSGSSTTLSAARRRRHRRGQQRNRPSPG